MSDLHTATIVPLESAADRVIIAAYYPNLSAEQLFAAFTQADLLTRWWSPAAETEPRPGGTYHVWWEKLGKSLRGVYREFEPSKRLVLTWKWDDDPQTPERSVAIDFAPDAAGGARLTLTHGFYGEGQAEAEDRQGHIEGWLYFLPQLEKVAP